MLRIPLAAQVIPSSLCVLPAHKVLQDGALARALATHHSDLRQVEGAALPRGAQRVLEAVDQRDQILHPAVAHRNRAAQRLL